VKFLKFGKPKNALKLALFFCFVSEYTNFMEKVEKPNPKPFYKNPYFWLIPACPILVLELVFLIKLQNFSPPPNKPVPGQIKSAEIQVPPPQLDFAAYDKKLNEIANNPIISTTTTSTNPSLLVRQSLGDGGWPVKTVYPNYGALLPFNRIVAYYGNLYAKGMGVLGEYPEDEMLDRLSTEVSKWQAADPNTPVIPALHYIAVVAQGGGGKDGKYRARMPDSEIQKVLAMAQKINGIVFLDVQVAQSNVQTEIPLLEKYLKFPQVHLGIDPEFAMQGNQKPGTAIGTLDAADINFAADYLAKIVRDNNLPPKVLVIHRFTQAMVTNYQNIKPLPEVQIVMDMDGFGSQASKLNTYKQFIYKQPVQFTGFKLFYKNDIANGQKMLAPEQILKLSPIPSYIQYQ
jgi:hypothetical protein